ncbi:hypothetical protein EMCRGX_G027952 [Ephydatia muelleri]
MAHQDVFYEGHLDKALQNNFWPGRRNALSTAKSSNRKSVTTNVTKDMNTQEDFLQLVTQAHVFAAAMQLLGCRSVTELRSKITNDISGDQAALNSLAAEISMETTSAARTLDHVSEYA